VHDLITALSNPVFSRPLAVGGAAACLTILTSTLVGPPALPDITAQAARAICLALALTNLLLGAILGALLFGTAH
jgi:hypothetical protein